MIEIVATCDKCKKEFRYNAVLTSETHDGAFSRNQYDFTIYDDQAPYFQWFKTVDGALLCNDCAKEYAQYKRSFFDKEIKNG